MFASSYTYRTFDKLRRVDQAAVVENERLGAVLAVIRDRQAETARKRNGAAPSRSFQPTHSPPAAPAPVGGRPAAPPSFGECSCR